MPHLPNHLTLSTHFGNRLSDGGRLEARCPHGTARRDVAPGEVIDWEQAEPRLIQWFTELKVSVACDCPWPGEKQPARMVS